MISEELYDVVTDEENLISLSINSEKSQTLERNFDPLVQKTVIKTFCDKVSELEPMQAEGFDPNGPKIIYDGRDILNLRSNIEFKWAFRPSKSANAFGFYKFSENNNRYTKVRKMRDAADGGYYYCFPSGK